MTDSFLFIFSIDLPWYGGGMPYGSVSPATMVGKAHAGRVWNTFTCTG